MTGLVDARGNPLMFAKSDSLKDGSFVSKPVVGTPMGQWAGRDLVHMTLPGGGVMQFNLDRLTMADYRAMKQHYQLGASLNVLGFILHQIDWHIDCDNKEIKDFLEDDLHKNWTMLIRAIAQAFWAGYSPIVTNYYNAPDGRVRIKNFKDLIPEECTVEWAEEEGWAPPGKIAPKIRHYNGFKQNGWWIPPANTLWYPLLMDNGDYYGRKLLKPAFPAWYFSNLMHLFANRFFERFGEPLPIGRAPFDQNVDMGGGTTVKAKTAMESVVGNIRNRSVVVLPSDRDPLTKEFDYSIEYLESQMRGADFERYLSRLDEEMSLSVFTPVLLFRTADVGSYNLGEAHLRIFQQMLNSIAGDIQVHLQSYLVDRMKTLNFPGKKVPEATWVFRKQGQGDIETYKLLMSELVRLGVAMPDLVELGGIVGLKFNEIEMLTTDPKEQPEPVIEGKTENTGARAKASTNSKMVSVAAMDIINQAAARVESQLTKGSVPTLGYKNALTRVLTASEQMHGRRFDVSKIDQMYGGVNNWIASTAPVSTPDEMKTMLVNILTSEVGEIA